MRKAFDANVPKLRPRLRGAVTEESAVQGGEPTSSVMAPDVEPPPSADGGGEAEIPLGLRVEEPAAAVPATVTATAAPKPTPKPTAAPTPTPIAAPAAEPAFTEAPDVQSRRERLMQVKRKVAAAARVAPPMPALPETPARAGESALALVRDLEEQLTRAREVELALRADLDQARGELARGAAEGRRTAERLAAVEQQVEEKRAVLQEMLAEMGGLEEERDGAVGRAQALAALDEERQALLDGLSTRAEQAERARAEAEAEVGRLGTELDGRAADAARLRAALAQVTRERDDLAREVAEARRERDELADARKALEQVHEALATARARLG